MSALSQPTGSNVPASETISRSPSRPRLESIDLLRGIIMVLMALDHTRDFFTNVRFDPLDLEKTTLGLYLTRWVTHFCAPNFIFLAGIGACLTGLRGRSTRELSWFLFSRGLWLAFLELSWVRSVGWEFNFDYSYVGVGVLWAIGWAMVVLAGLVYLPRQVVGMVGIGMIAFHNLLDPIRPEVFGPWAVLWGVLHVTRPFQITPEFQFAVGYPLIPWIGVLASGYWFGTVFSWESARRRRVLGWSGVALTVMFLVVRGLNGYGNPTSQELGQDLPNGRWSVQRNWLLTVLSFLDVHKYPPSLDYLFMTIGPALIVLAFLERGTPAWLRPLLVFGRVPLFYYLLHIPLIHLAAVVLALIRHGTAAWLFVNPFGKGGLQPPANAGVNLAFVYLAWVAIVLLLYPACRWFADFKRRRNDVWLSYL